jgi:hypothetical protein
MIGQGQSPNLKVTVLRILRDLGRFARTEAGERKATPKRNIIKSPTNIRESFIWLSGSWPSPLSVSARKSR